MGTTPRLEIQDIPDESLVRDLINSLVASNAREVPAEEHRRLAVFARSGEAVVGGCYGYTHWQWLFVSHLWVEERHRRHGLGSQLLEAIEEEGLQRGAVAVHLDTYDFQAPHFYLKLGYKVFGELDEYPAGHRRYFMFKKL